MRNERANGQIEAEVLTTFRRSCCVANVFMVYVLRCLLRVIYLLRCCYSLLLVRVIATVDGMYLLHQTLLCVASPHRTRQLRCSNFGINRERGYLHLVLVSPGTLLLRAASGGPVAPRSKREA